MSFKRILGENSGPQFYHCISRVVDRRVVFGRGEKEVFRSILRKLEIFLSVRVATYCLMGNHFHLLLDVPDREALAPLDAERLLALLPLLYDPVTVNNVAKQLASAREKADTAAEKAILDRYERRRGDLSVFLKELKQRVSIFMNHRLGRTGTLWEGRFKSVLVEGGEAALQTVAAYIDLNPVRAGLVAKPEDYRWSGYGEACGSGKGSKLARENLGAIQREGLESPGTSLKWRQTQDRYRRQLYFEGAERKADEITGAGARRGIAVEGTIEGLKARGHLSVVRKSGANRLRGGANWGELGRTGANWGELGRTGANCASCASCAASRSASSDLRRAKGATPITPSRSLQISALKPCCEGRIPNWKSDHFPSRSSTFFVIRITAASFPARPCVQSVEPAVITVPPPSVV